MSRIEPSGIGLDAASRKIEPETAADELSVQSYSNDACVRRSARQPQTTKAPRNFCDLNFITLKNVFCLFSIYPVGHKLTCKFTTTVNSIWPVEQHNAHRGELVRANRGPTCL